MAARYGTAVARTPRPRRDQIGGDIVLESPGDFKTVHPGDIIGICIDPPSLR